jgi:toxin YoeB
LNKLFVAALKDISKNPMIGRKTDMENVRAKIVREYLLFYEISDEYVYVLSVWDNRRDNTSRSYK